ncbi:PREDICTED: putative late blight resistance protein homolog R1A-10 [Nicotiana attenuata]|uniref:putative late blight resistance protein homolog R1A-10 n=1 Tax=Nicotiana attenuata TaxID=49451 RepID=UPI000904C423|nr:PREDICTED: putative late blight resistance protein homolog R1A-10 [Nicotiana attenuata]
MEIVSDFSTTTHDADYNLILQSTRVSRIGTSSTSIPVLPNLESDIVHGLDDDLKIIVKRLTGQPSDLAIVTISGMGGIGKTTLARKAHDHLPIRYHFDIRVWVTISQEYRSRNVLLDLLHCISKQTNIVNENDYDKDDSKLADLVQKSLKGRRYLVVVDDIWSTDVWESIRGIFPNYNNGSRILLTTRETEVAMYANTSIPHEMNLLHLENSWKLLRDKVFGPKNDHPPELEKIGKQIVEKCQGLPLTISVVAGHLSKMDRTLKSWKDVARTLGEVVASHPDKCLGVLGLSYHHLPNHLKPCFLSMGDFPEDFQVETWRLIQLWIAEGLIITTSESHKSLEEVAENYLDDLINRNLIMAIKRRFNGEIRTCAMHDLLREFCLIEAKMTKFVHVERKRTYPPLPPEKHIVRRFSFQTREHSADDCRKLLPPVARSIYVFSRLLETYLPCYELLDDLLGMAPITRRHYILRDFFSHFKLLRVLAIFNKDEMYLFRTFPLEITKLFHLRYLQVRFSGDIPESITELQNLQTLINHGERDKLVITSPGNIWVMNNLRHIHMGGPIDLVRESILDQHLAIGMPNLEELSGLCSLSCTSEVFSRIPNLKRLVIYEISSRREGMANRLIDMSNLTKLVALKCWEYDVPKPISIQERRYDIPKPISIKMFVFPTSLKRLTLYEFRFPWEDISTLAMLPNLEELKLKEDAFKGGVWRLSNEDKFESLKLLLIASTTFFYRWEASSDNFPNLKRLVLKYCHYLEEIPTDFGEICTLESIELHYCSTTADNSAREIKQEQEDMGNTSLNVEIHELR